MGNFRGWPPKEKYETVVQELESESRDAPPKKAKKAKKQSKQRLKGSRK